MADRHRRRINFPLNSQSYKLTCKISSGLRAEIYKAVCLPNSEIVAIKIISFEGCSIETLSASQFFSHPNLLPTYCSFMDEEDREWTVMPFLAAGSLLSLNRENSGYSEPILSVILRETLRALVFLHGRSLFHGDVKPSNILLSPEGSIILADYGISESIYDPDSGRFRPPKGNKSYRIDPESGSFVFTGYVQETRCFKNTNVTKSYWKPPEKVYSDKFDIWTLGITALELTAESSFLRLGKRKYEEIETENPFKHSQEYSDMISLCLHPDPTKRPSAQDLLGQAFFIKYNSLGSTLIKDDVLSRIPSIENRAGPSKGKESIYFKPGKKEPIQNRRARSTTVWKFTKENLTLQRIRAPNLNLNAPTGTHAHDQLTEGTSSPTLEQSAPIPFDEWLNFKMREEENDDKVQAWYSFRKLAGMLADFFGLLVTGDGIYTHSLIVKLLDDLELDHVVFNTDNKVIRLLETSRKYTADVIQKIEFGKLASTTDGFTVDDTLVQMCIQTFSQGFKYFEELTGGSGESNAEIELSALTGIKFLESMIDKLSTTVMFKSTIGELRKSQGDKLKLLMQQYIQDMW